MLLGCDICPVTAIMSLQNNKNWLKQNNENQKYINISQWIKRNRTD